MKNAKRFFFSVFTFIVFFGLAGCDGCKDRLGNNVKEVSFDEVEDVIITDAQARERAENYRVHRGEIIKVYEDNGRGLNDSIPQNQQSYERDEKKSGQTKMQRPEKGFVPVEYTYYDYGQLKKYLQYIEQETKKAGADISTMRVYFANYPENDEDIDKRKRNTIMFVPTINIGEKESAYFINEDKDGVSRPFLLDEFLARTGKPAPEESLTPLNDIDEANLLLNISYSPLQDGRSVIANEGGRNPPAHNR